VNNFGMELKAVDPAVAVGHGGDRAGAGVRDWRQTHFGIFATGHRGSSTRSILDGIPLNNGDLPSRTILAGPYSLVCPFLTAPPRSFAVICWP